MVGHDKVLRPAGRKRQAGQELADITRQAGHLRGAIRIERIVAQNEAVILDHRAAAGCCDEDRVERRAQMLAVPRVDVVARGNQARLFAPHVMDERATAAFTTDKDGFISGACQHADGCGPDGRPQHGLRATLQQRDTDSRLMDGCNPDRGRGRQMLRREPQHGGQWAERRHLIENAADRPRQPGQPERGAEAARIRHHGRQ